MYGPPTESRRLTVIWGETRMGAEAARLMTSGVWRGAGVPDGDGQPVLLVPGFLAGDGSLAVLAQWLKRTGHRPHGSRITTNIACSQQTVRRLERRVIELSERYERPVAVIGHSRGGMIGRVLAVRHPGVRQPRRRARLAARREHGRPASAPAPADPRPAARPARGRRGPHRLRLRAELGGVQVRPRPHGLLHAVLGGPRRRRPGRRELHLDLLAQRRRPALARVPRSAGAPRRGVAARTAGWR